MKLLEIYQNSFANRVMESVGSIYSDSIPARFGRRWSDIYENSLLHSVFNTEKEKEQAYKNSFAYLALKRIIEIINKLSGAIHGYITGYFKCSITGQATEVLNKDSKNYVAVILFAALGYALGKTILRGWSPYSAMLFAAFGLLSLAAIIPFSRWKNWFIQSFCNKIINFFFEK